MGERTESRFAARQKSGRQYDLAVLGGPDLLAYLVLAFGGALLVGNVMALVRPPVKRDADMLAKAPRGRTMAMALLGLVVTIWAIATLLA